MKNDFTKVKSFFYGNLYNFVKTNNMNINKSILTLPLLAVSFLGLAQKLKVYHKDWIDFNKNGKKDIFEDRKAPIDKRVENLLSQMTLQEKANQTVTLYGYGRILKDEQPTPQWKNEIWVHGLANIDEMLNSLPYHKSAVTKYSYPYSNHTEALNNIQKWFIEETRLGIPVDFTNEGIHGLTHDRATPFPAPINIGSTWDKDLVGKIGNTIGKEAYYLGYTNVYAPILDVSRDPRWGRVVETYGEDPFMIGEYGKRMVKGIQQNGVASTLKHYAVYSVPKGGRDGLARTDPHVAPREMHTMYLYPFKEVIRKEHPLGVMASYNDYDGVPVISSKYFLTDLLRKEYGFDGYVVSDSDALEFVHSKHHVAKDYEEGIQKALEAGLDVRTNFTQPKEYLTALMDALKSGKIKEEVLNERVRAVLKTKFKLGLFDEPIRSFAKEADRKVHTKEDEALSVDVNRRSVVLLKNEKQTLPLDIGKLKNILITGPLADAVNYTTSRYGPSNNPVTTIRKGIEDYASLHHINTSYTKGVDVIDEGWPETEIIPVEPSEKEKSEIAKTISMAEKSDVIVAVMGESEREVGESRSRSSLNLPGKQTYFLQQLYKTGKPVVLVLVNGRPLTINWENKYLPAILETWFLGPQSGKIVAETLFGDHNPGGKLPISFPKSIGQLEMNFPTKPAAQAGQPGTGPNGSGSSRVTGFLYPFGYGLSYTNFEFADFSLSSKKIKAGDELHVKLKVTNTGKVKGDEVVQLYLSDLVSSVTTYEMDLRGFERVTLEPGETKEVQFTLNKEHMQLLNDKMEWVVEPGEFRVSVGNSSENIRFKEIFEVED